MTGEGVAERLRARLAAGAGTAADRARAERLAARLETPRRLAFVGPGLAGRAATAEALLGVAALPEGADRPALEIVHGPDGARARFSCGRVDPVPDVAAALADPAVVMLTLSRPAAALRRLSLLDVVTDTAPREMAAALAWAAGRADLLVWWSDAFADPERAVWAARPAAMRDHGFVALRDAGALAAPDPETVAAVAMEGDGPARLAGALSEHVAGGRQADEDAARLLLQALGRSGAGPDRTATARGAPPARPATTPFGAARRRLSGTARPAGDTPPARPGTGHGAASACAADGPDPGGERLDDAAVAPPPVSGADAGNAPPHRPAEPAETHAARREILSRAGAHLRRRARALLEAVEAEGPEPDVARHCLDTLERLTELLDTEGPGEDPALAALSDRLAEAEETLVLLEIEGPGAGRVDAVNLMVQLQRDVAAQLPA